MIALQQLQMAISKWSYQLSSETEAVHLAISDCLRCVSRYAIAGARPSLIAVTEFCIHEKAMYFTSQ
jgi:hypothetical protein